jgi:CHAT domain-containing protein
VTVKHPETNEHLTYLETARFFQRALSDEQQIIVQRHCADCADCRHQLSLAMEMLGNDNSTSNEPDFTALLATGQRAAKRALLAETAAGAAHEAQARHVVADAVPADWFRLWLRPALVTLAVVTCLALPLGWWWTARESSLDRSLASLRQSWTVNRPLESRVTGGFPPLPFERVRSANTNSPSLPVNQDKLLAADAELKRAVADNATPAARHMLARLHLLKQEFDLAETQLQQVIKAQPNNAEALVDLAALNYERGVAESSFPTLLRASEAATKAVELAPDLPEAWFNRALIDEQMFKMTEAQKDWERFLALDSTSQWADEARLRLAKLRQRAALPEPQPDKLTADLHAAVAARDDAAVRQLLDANFSLATDLFATRWLDDYLAAAETNAPAPAPQRALVSQVATVIRDTRGDHFFADLWQSVAQATPARIAQVRALRALLQQSQTEYLPGNYAAALKLAAAAQTAATRLGDVCHTEIALYYQARIYTPETETPARAVVRARLLAEASNHHHLQMQAKALLARSNQFGSERKFSQWLVSNLQAKEIANSIKDNDLMILSLNNLGDANSSIGESEKGLEAHYLAVQSVYKAALNWRRVCGTYVPFSNSLSYTNHSLEAYAYQQEALPYCRRGGSALYSPALGRAGKYAALTGKLNESVNLFQQALAEGELVKQKSNGNSSLADLFVFLGDALVQSQRYGEAEVAYGKAIEQLGQHQSLFYLSAIQQGLAAAYLPQGKIREAEAALRKGIEFTEQSRGNVDAANQRNQFAHSRLSVYQSMVGFQYFYQHAPEIAFASAEIYRNRELLDVLAQTPEIRQEQGRYDLRLAGVATPLTLSQLQKNLPPQTQLIEYAITEKHLLIWVIDQASCADAQVEVTPDQLQKAVSEYLEAVTQRRPLAEVNAQAQALYQWLIQPVAGWLKSDSHLVVVPDGALDGLPFAALVRPGSQRYLIEDYALSVSPSASLLVELLKRGSALRARPPQSLLAVSNPAFDRRLFPRLAELPGAGTEARDLMPLYARTAQLAGTDATKAAVLQAVKQYDVLHLAAHSLANTRNPLLSAIVLARAPTGEAESLWPAHEIFRLRLPHTRLVILSSCNSLVNRPAGANGLGGLAHAFFSARVPTVIGSLWEVKDESTSALLSAFHRHWRTDGINTGEALRRAQLAFLRADNETWRHPLYWAAFHVSGDAITI